MKRAEPKSHCPINYALEVFGDTWSMLIIRDIVFSGKKTYGEFLGSEEAIATNVLAARLQHLEQKGVLQKQLDPLDKRREIYSLTEDGLDLIPILIEMLGWSAYHDANTDAPKIFTDYVNADRTAAFQFIKDTVRAGGAIFAGPNNVIDSIGLPRPTPYAEAV